MFSNFYNEETIQSYPLIETAWVEAFEALAGEFHFSKRVLFAQPVIGLLRRIAQRNAESGVTSGASTLTSVPSFARNPATQRPA